MQSDELSGLDGFTAADNRASEYIGLGSMSKDMPDCSAACYQKMIEYGRNLVETIQRDVKEYNGITAGQIVEGISRIYSDYRNLQINIIDTETVVMEEIRGSKAELIQRRLEYFRKATR